jgi:type I restriction enzyme M protein
MRKSLGSKRNVMSEDDIKTITLSFGNFEVIDATSLADMGLDKPVEVKSNRGRQSANQKAETTKTFACKIFNSYEFGYRRLTIERPLRLSAQITDAAIESLRFAPKPLNTVMVALYEQFGSVWTQQTSGLNPSDINSYGQFSEVEVEARAMIKADFPELKEKQIKDVLEPKLWMWQQSLMNDAKRLQQAVGDAFGGKAKQSDDLNQFELTLKGAFKATGIKFDAKQKKQFIDAITWKNPDAAPVVKKVLKDDAQPLYGAFEYQGNVKGLVGHVVEYQQDGDLRDNENVPLSGAYQQGKSIPSITTSELIETYFNKEVAPHVADAWINADKRDDKDGEIGIVGYEIPFNRHFYVHHLPRDLEKIDIDLDAVSKDIMKLLKEVH